MGQPGAVVGNDLLFCTLGTKSVIRQLIFVAEDWEKHRGRIEASPLQKAVVTVFIVQPLVSLADSDCMHRRGCWSSSLCGKRLALERISRAAKYAGGG